MTERSRRYMFRPEDTMTILGIETATEHLGAALIIEGSIRLERYINSRSSHCELLTGFILELSGEAGITPSSIDCISVSVGPGSFTGLRIGIATAMGLAYGLGISIAPVNTLAALARNAAEPGRLVCPLIDARRSDVYAGLYRVTDGVPDTVVEPAALPPDTLAGILSKTAKPVILTGPAAHLFKDRLETVYGSPLSCVPEQDAHPKALSVAELGLILFHSGGGVHPASIKPVYLRRSDAEIARNVRCS